MECVYCGADISDKGLLITKAPPLKQWACVNCFVTALIEGRADIIHHWGFAKEEAKEEQVEGQVNEKDDGIHPPTFLGKERRRNVREEKTV